MNEQLLRTNHIVVRNFLSKEWAEEIYVDFRDHGRVDSAYKDGYSGPCYFYESPVGGQELLYYMTQKMVDHVGERLYPTYSYLRCYNKGSYLPLHDDRPACEISVSIHLGSDKPWEFIIQDPEKNSTEVILEQGDAIIYLGCVGTHGRKGKYDGDHYIQMFLHYVRSRGSMQWCMGDLNRSKLPNGWQLELVDEYKELLETSYGNQSRQK